MMRRVLVLTSMGLLLGPAVRLSAQKAPTFNVTRPTIIAFFRAGDRRGITQRFRPQHSAVGLPISMRGKYGSRKLS